MKRGRIFSAVVVAALAALATPWVQASDPVVMRVGGTDVHRSEYEYYRKKASTPADLDARAFARMVGQYKQRVLAARAAGLDTLPAYRAEMQRYVAELAKSEIEDSTLLRAMVAEGAKMRSQELEMNYFVLPLGVPAQRADSIRRAIASGSLSFDDAARRFSADPVAGSYGGRMGWTALGGLPFEVEQQIASVSPGKLSSVLDTPNGYMIVEGGRRRALTGGMEAAVIVLTHDGTDSGAARVKAQADSIYGVLRESPGKFPALARKYSMDAVTRNEGGRLGTFYAGDALPEIMNTLEALPEGGVGEPLPLGKSYLILRRGASVAPPTFEQLQRSEERRIRARVDGRFQKLEDDRRDRLRRIVRARFTPEYKKLIGEARKRGLDSTLMQEFASAPMVRTAAGSFTLRELAPSLLTTKAPAGKRAETLVRSGVEAGERVKLDEIAPAYIMASRPALAALMREYEEGSLMYEINRRNVWQRASDSPAELEQYFEEHRDDYVWRRPRVSGWLLSAASSDLLKELTSKAMHGGLDALRAGVAERVGEARLNRVLVAEGEDAVVDALLAGRTPSVAPGSLRYVALLDAQLIAQPASAADAGGGLLRDYQNHLEELWQQELDALYPIELLK